MSNNILVVAPHADDEILGLGGTISKFLKKKFKVTILILSNANLGAPELFSKKKIKQIREEAIASHKSLGVINTIFAEFPALQLKTFPSYKLSSYLEKVFLKINPEYLYIPFPNDLHDDHEKVYKCCLVASRPSKKLNINNILVYEVLSETNYAPTTGSNFNPNYYEDITSTLKNKIKAMKFYKSQLLKYPHCRSLEMIEYLARYRGSFINKKYAESFMIERIYNP